jgi:hypothetical protein
MTSFPEFEELQTLLDTLHAKALTAEQARDLKDVVRRVNGIIERTPANDHWVAGFWRVPGSPARQIVAATAGRATCANSRERT